MFDAADIDKCPVCNKDRSMDMTEVKQLCFDSGLDGGMMNPGGRRLYFADGGELQIAECCNACDEKKIRRYLSRRTV